MTGAKERLPSGAANSGRSRLQPASGAVQPAGDIQAPPLVHEISRAEGPRQQTTAGDGLSDSRKWQSAGLPPAGQRCISLTSVVWTVGQPFRLRTRFPAGPAG